MKAMIEYINSRGRISMKGFATWEEGEAFAKKLDERIKKGTCGGYILSPVGYDNANEQRTVTVQ